MAPAEQQTKSPELPVNFDSIKTNDKKDEDFRVYNEQETPARVIEHYKDMRTHHTVDFYRRMEKKYSFENGAYRKLMTIEEAFAELESYIVGLKKRIVLILEVPFSSSHDFLFLSSRP